MRKLTSLILFLLCMHSAQADRFYVDADAPAGGNGQSWATAFQFLQDALDQTVAGRGDAIWIAEGTYYPDDGASVTEGDRTATFLLKDGVSLHGGFQGNETDLGQRDIAIHPSILSGSIFAQQDFWSLHVCTVDQSASVAFDGLTVRDGNANGASYPNNEAGAVLYADDLTQINVTVTSCAFINNSAALYGGVTTYGNWTVTDSMFIGNSSGSSGGVNTDGNWTVKASTFSGNSTAGNGGVASGGNWTVTDSTFTENSAGSGGVASGGNWTVTDSALSRNSATSGGGLAYFGTWTVTGSTFSGNYSGNDGGVTFGGNWTVTGSTFSGNSAADLYGVARSGSWCILNSIIDSSNISTNSSYIFGELTEIKNYFDEEFPTPSTPRAKNIIQGGTNVLQAATLDLGMNLVIDADPLFVNAADPDGSDNLFGTADDGFRLQAGSPAIGEGDAGFLPEDTYDLDNDGDTNEPLPLDRAGFLRVQDGSLDLGAYEFGDSMPQQFTLTVSSDGNGSVMPSGSQDVPEGTIETLTATPNPGYLFDTWSGSVSTNTNPIIITISTNLSITANFTPDLNDPDEDGLSNFDEIVTYGSNPNVNDTSGDGLLDGTIVNAGYDPQENYTALIGLVTNNPSAYNLYSESEIAELAMNGIVLTNSGTGFEVEWTVETNSTLNATDWQVHERIIRPVDMGNGVLFLRIQASAAE